MSQIHRIFVKIFHNALVLYDFSGIEFKYN